MEVATKSVHHLSADVRRPNFILDDFHMERLTSYNYPTKRLLEDHTDKICPNKTHQNNNNNPLRVLSLTS